MAHQIKDYSSIGGHMLRATHSPQHMAAVGRKGARARGPARSSTPSTAWRTGSRGAYGQRPSPMGSSQSIPHSPHQRRSQ